ncbi:CAAX prenyl protease-like protein [Homoserinimonas aerilata]|uniref:CAAX prenyl protease-like protein n=1 Tax=Homoserinimonas aerilata TaxID=1162970 RepID=A0A542YGP9_9MICO|nr:type II CAAX endopeptidase family protein [Homoserinimonas aerilata]TQL47257.1 CAAX prenyl protease-like protein [Homoserinimonas aerilata]
MLSPSQPLSPAVLVVVLVALLLGLILRTLRKDRREYGRFKRLRSTARRQKFFAKWLRESFLLFGGASLVILALAWQYVPLMLGDIERLPAMQWLRQLMVDGAGVTTAIIWGGGAILLLGPAIAIWAARHSDEVPSIGDIAALLPRNRQELGWGAAMSVNAGIVEELMFRLALPTLVYAVSGNAVIAVVGSVLLFGLLHLYQGVPGIVGSIAIGALLMALFLVSGSILLAIVAHALIDLRSLVLIPVVVYEVHKPKGQRRAALAQATGTAPTATPAGTSPDPRR